MALTPFGAVPSGRQLLWHGTEVYSIVHFGINTFADKEWGYGDEPTELFNPTEFDARQWARVCKESGVKGMILVCKHHDGFCLWPTKTTERCVRNSPWKGGEGDMVAEVAAACREQGLKFGTYISPWDRNHAEYGRDGYVKAYHQQLRELLSNYGPLFEVWFDGANGGDGFYGGARERRGIDAATYYQWDKITAMVRELQPEACMFGNGDIRFVGNENGLADETCWSTYSKSALTASGDLGSGVRGADQWVPAECDFPLRGGWFYHEGDEVKDSLRLAELYFKSVGRGCSMNIGLAPDRRGLIHDDDIKALRGWRELLDATFAENLAAGAKVSASSERGPDFAAANVLSGDGFWSPDTSDAAPELFLDFSKPVKFNLVELMEKIELGQRIDAFEVDAWLDGAWAQRGGATSVGHKRLLMARLAETNRIRLRFTQSAASPAIASLKLFKAPLSMVADCRLCVVRNAEGLVEIRCSNSGMAVGYTLDGSEPDKASPLYRKPFPLPAGGTVKAFAYLDGEESFQTATVSATFGVDRGSWKVVSVSLDSPFDNRGHAGVAKLLDDNHETYWHTYHKDKSLSAPPHEVVLDMGRTIEVAAFTFTPAGDGSSGGEGTPDHYEYHLSHDGESWTLAAAGEFSNIKASLGPRLVKLDKPMSGRYLRFVVKHVVDDGDYVVVAGVGVVEK